MTAAGIWLIQGGAAENRGEYTIYVGWITVLFFGPISLLWIPRVVPGGATKVRLSADGLTDGRSFTGELPWTGIAKASTSSARGTSMIRLELTDDAHRNLSLTRTAAFARWLNRPFGLDGVYLVSADLDITHDDLWELVQTYLKAYNPSALEDLG